eukprot:scaffold57019_cov15-Tisochrysis_lutea.AAC.1
MLPTRDAKLAAKVPKISDVFSHPPCSEEDEDVAAMVAVLSKRDAQLEAELGARGGNSGPASKLIGMSELGARGDDLGPASKVNFGCVLPPLLQRQAHL